jgi:hypothetical protein
MLDVGYYAFAPRSRTLHPNLTVFYCTDICRRPASLHSAFKSIRHGEEGPASKSDGLLLCGYKPSSRAFTFLPVSCHPERRKYACGIFSESNFQKRTTNRAFLKGKGLLNPLRISHGALMAFRGKCNFSHESYWISLVDPAAADALRFCLFGQALKAQKFDAGLRPCSG